ncbi:MAG: hypothetical protein JHD15_07095 [Phenylobacterium sp.]|uniref:hypothetical protein n=1 Tax=Phenylobacterium sp. TaxID=1871053 RepID=UPI001A2D4E42|nr:hypothetical protein [Phenylobacterium sp.]MBJ7410119.1 hypothetical protein [Phenylobacterium sp.]
MAVTPNSIVTPQTPVFKTAVATAAETAFNTPTAVVTLIDDATQNTNGLRLTSVYAIARAAVSTNPINCQLYKKVGTTFTLIDSVLIAVGTPSASVANQKGDFGYSEGNPLTLEAGVGLAVAIGTATANGVAFVAKGGAY